MQHIDPIIWEFMDITVGLLIVLVKVISYSFREYSMEKATVLFLSRYLLFNSVSVG